jgi:TM2 domain-containing membrane protein YozV
MLSGVIYLVTFGVEIFVFCALFATYIAPLFAIAVLGPDRRQTAHLNPLRYMPIPAHPHKQPVGE